MATQTICCSGPLHWREMAQRLGLKEVLLIDADRNVEMTPAMGTRLALREKAVLPH